MLQSFSSEPALRVVVQVADALAAFPHPSHVPMYAHGDSLTAAFLQPELLSVSGGAPNEKPRPVCAGGVLIRVLIQSLRRIADDHHHTHDDHCGRLRSF